MIELNQDNKYLLLVEDGKGIVMKLHHCKYDDEDDSYYNNYLNEKGYFYDENDGFYYLDKEGRGFPKPISPDGQIQTIEVKGKYKLKGKSGTFELQDNDDCLRITIPPFKFYFKRNTKDTV